MGKVSILIAAALLALFWQSAQVKAAPNTHNQNLIIYDEEFYDWQAHTEIWVQAFLDSHTGILKNYIQDGRTAAKIIFDASQQYQISPKVILVMLQKEQSLIEDPTRESVLYKAMGYGCPTTGSCAPEFFGFANQVDLGTKALRRYVDRIRNDPCGCTVSGWKPGQAKATLDGDIVTPANDATAAFYTYTPHLSGNYSFWNIWKRYGFDLLRKYPDGSLIRASGDPRVWLVQSGEKRWFTNSGAFLARYDFSQVIKVPPDHLALYSTGQSISYPNFALLSSPKGGVYLLVDDLKRPITSREAFVQAGFSWSSIVTVPWEELSKFPDGDSITTENVYPAGRLVQNKITGAVFYAKEGKRYPVVCREILKSQFGGSKPTPLTPTQLDTLTEGPPVGFKEGSLVTSGSTAYVISGGYKLPIDDPATFNAFRFNWGNLRMVSNPCLEVHPTGPLLTIHEPVGLGGQ